METKNKPSRMKRLLLVVGVGIILTCTCLFIVVIAFPSDSQTSTVDEIETKSGLDENTLSVSEVDKTTIPEPIITNAPNPTQTQIIGRIDIGTHLVGNGIKPGIYWGMAGDGILSSCYWARLSDLTGELGSINANDNAVGQFYVEVKDTDIAFETGCVLISLENASSIEIGNSVSPGIYIIGRDIKPGLYQGQAGEDIFDSCYWSRLKNVSGDMDSILANDNATGSYYIQVLDSDFALKTGCSLEWISE